jgi:hypothetical protein
MSGTTKQEKDRKKAALEELLEKTRAEFEKSYAGVWDEASAEITEFDGLPADPDTVRSGTNSKMEVETPEPKPVVGLQVPDRAVGNKWKRTVAAAKGWTEGQSSASADSTENFALVTATYSTMVELSSSDEAPDAPPSLPLVMGYQAGGDGGGSQKGASSAAASSASSLPPVTGDHAGGRGGVLVIVGGHSSAASSSSPPGGGGPALTKKERVALSKSQQMEKRDMKVLARPICDLPESWVKATWPKVDCTQCGFVDHWKGMENHLLNDSWERVFSCNGCIMRREDLPDTAVTASWIVTNHPGFQRKSMQVAAFNHARDNGKKEFPMMGRSGIRQLQRDSLVELFAPLADAFSRKRQHMEVLGSRHAHHQALALKLKSVTTTAERDVILSELDAVFQRDFLLAFADSTPEVQDRFHLASSYSDEWVSSPAGHLRMWYICRGRTGGWDVSTLSSAECLRLITSKKWDTLYEDPLAPGQRWWCSCGTRFKCRYGVICEIETRGIEGTQYARAWPPNEHVEDGRALFYQDTIKPSSPEDLYEQVPVVGPQCSAGMITIHDEAKGEYVIDRAFDASLPVWEWAHMFFLCGVVLPEEISKKEAKKRSNEVWYGPEATAQRLAEKTAAKSKKDGDWAAWEESCRKK